MAWPFGGVGSAETASAASGAHGVFEDPVECVEGGGHREAATELPCPLAEDAASSAVLRQSDPGSDELVLAVDQEARRPVGHRVDDAGDIEADGRCPTGASLGDHQSPAFVTSRVKEDPGLSHQASFLHFVNLPEELHSRTGEVFKPCPLRAVAGDE